MLKIFFASAAILMAVGGVTAQEMKKTEIPQNISAFPSGDENSGYAQYFSG